MIPDVQFNLEATPVDFICDVILTRLRGPSDVTGEICDLINPNRFPFRYVIFIVYYLLADIVPS